MAYQIQIRSDSANNWSTVNPVLAQAEFGYETDTGKLKIGNGSTAWANLSYFAGGGNGGGGDYSNANVTAFLADGQIGNIIPLGNNLQSLGNANNQWKDLWISNNTIYINSIPISLVANNTLTVDGNAVVTTSGNGVTNVTAMSVAGNVDANFVNANIAGAYGYEYANIGGAPTALSAFTNDVGFITNVVTSSFTVANTASITGALSASFINASSNIHSNVGLSTDGNIVASHDVSVGGNANVFHDVNAGNNIFALGNITTVNGHFIGDGSLLTNVIANVNYSNSNVASFLPNNTSNVAGAYFLGNGSQLTGMYGNADVAAYLPTYGGDLNLDQVTANTVTAGLGIFNNLNVTDLNVTGNSTTANVGTLDVANAMIFVGANNTTSLFDEGLVAQWGNGVTQWSGLVRDKTNGVWKAFNSLTQPTANVVDWANATYVPFQASAFIGDGGNLSNINYSNITGAYGDANVAAFLPVYTGNISADTVSTGNIAVTNTANIVMANVVGLESTNVSVSGNVIANIVEGNAIYADDYFYSNGQPFIHDDYSNANVANYLPVYNGGIAANYVMASGNVTATFFHGNGAFLTGISGGAGGYGDANVAAFLSSGTLLTDVDTAANVNAADVNASGNVDASGNVNAGGVLTAGNITAGYYFGNGSQLSGMFGNADVANFLPTYTGNISADTVTANGIVANIANINGDLGVTGNFNVLGTFNTANTANLDVANAVIVLGANNVTNVIDEGIVALFGVGNVGYSAGIMRDHVTSEWRVFEQTGNITQPVDWANVTYQPVRASAFIGDGGFLSNISYANVVGSYGDANVAAYLPAYTGNLAAGNLLVAGDITANGNAYLYNISSTGSANLTNVGVIANVYANGILTDNYYYANGVPVTFGGGTGNYSNANVVSLLPLYTGNVNAAFYFGDAGYLSNINAANVVGSYGNANVAAFLAVNSGPITADTIVANTVSAVLSGDGGNISNIQYANITGAYGDANVQSFLPNYTGNLNAVYLGDAGYLSNIQYANVVGAYGDANVTALLPTYTGDFTANSVSTTGAITASLLSSTGNVDVVGNLNVTGNLNYSNVSSVNVANALIYLAANNVADLFDIGFLGSYNNGTQQQAGLVRDHTDNTWKLVSNVSGTANTVDFANAVFATFKAGAVTATSFAGDGGYLSNIQSANIVGAYGNANVASFLPTYAGVLGASSITAAGNIVGNMFIGDGSLLTGLPAGYTDANVYLYLPTNTSDVAGRDILASRDMQTPNITVANTVTASNVAAFSVTGNTASFTGTVTAAHFVGDGSGLSNVQRPVLVTSNITGAVQGVPVLVDVNMTDTTYTGGIFTIYQPATGMGVTVTDSWATTGTSSKNQYTDFANNVVNSSALAINLTALGGTFNVQPTDSITIGSSVVTGANLTGLGIANTGGSYTIPAAMFAAGIQTTASVPVSVALTTTNGNTTTVSSATGTTLTTVAPTPFNFTAVTGSWPVTNVIGNADQSLNWSASGFTGTIVASNVSLSGSSNISLSTGTATSGNSAAIASNIGPYTISAVYTGTGLNGSGTVTVTQTGNVVPAVVIQPLYWQITSNSTVPTFTLANDHLNDAFSLVSTPRQGAYTNGVNTDYLWIAIPGTSWVFPNNVPATNNPNIYIKTDNGPFVGINVIVDPGLISTTTINGAPYTVFGVDGYGSVSYIYCTI